MKAKKEESIEVIGNILYANGRAYIDMSVFLKLQAEYSELLAASVKKQPCKMVVMKGGVV